MLDPLLDQFEVVVFGDLGVLFLLYPGHEVREQVGIQIAACKNAIYDVAEEDF